MKQLNFKLLIIGIALLTSMQFTACKSKPKDSDLQASFTEKSRSDAQMSNITATANDGVLTLNGQCPDEACKTNAEKTAHDIAGVSSVVNNITIMAPPPAPAAPVDVATDDALTNGVRDATKDHPGVKAEVTNGEVNLTGEIKRADLAKLMMSLNSLNPKKINNNLTIK